jgi:hypothetical protein
MGVDQITTAYMFTHTCKQTYVIAAREGESDRLDHRGFLCTCVYVVVCDHVCVKWGSMDRGASVCRARSDRALVGRGGWLTGKRDGQMGVCVCFDCGVCVFGSD